MCEKRQVQNLLKSRTVNLNQDCVETKIPCSPPGPPQIRCNSKTARALPNGSTMLGSGVFWKVLQNCASIR